MISLSDLDKLNHFLKGNLFVYTKHEKQQIQRHLNQFQTSSSDTLEKATEAVTSTDVADWPNRETYLAALHLSCSRDLYQRTLTVLTKTDDVDTAAHNLAEAIYAYRNRLQLEPQTVSDKWQAMLTEIGDLWPIEWVILVEHFSE